MFKNEGTTDRVLRVIAGSIILSLAFIGPKSPIAYIGLIPLLTGLIGWCPIYTLLGKKTRKDPE